jgi:protein-disulfide isomerase
MKNDLFIPVSLDDHHKGDLNAPLVLVEYGDFQCPTCSSMYPNVERALRYFDKELAFVFRHFPLMSIHPNALDAAVLSELAAEKGNFWNAYDRLFRRNTVFDKVELCDMALSLGIEEQYFKDSIRGGKHVVKVLKSIEDGLKSNVNGSPNFFLNGKKLIVPYGTDIIKSIDHEINISKT